MIACQRLAFDVGFLYSRQYVTGGEVVSNWWIVAAAAVQIGVEVVGQVSPPRVVVVVVVCVCVCVVCVCVFVFVCARAVSGLCCLCGC